MIHFLGEDPMEGIAKAINAVATEEFSDTTYSDYVATLEAQIISLKARIKYLEDIVNQ